MSQSTVKLDAYVWSWICTVAAVAISGFWVWRWLHGKQEKKWKDEAKRVDEAVEQLVDDQLPFAQRAWRIEAGCRHAETAMSSSPLIQDPLAAAVSGKYGSEAGRIMFQQQAKLEGPNKHCYWAARARILDDELSKELAKLHRSNMHGTLQVLSIGGGMDTRPWRLKRIPPGIVWVEVNDAPIVKLKTTLLQEAVAAMGEAEASTNIGAKHPLAVSEYWAVACGEVDWEALQAALQQVHYSRDLPTLVLLDNFLPYLQPSAAAAALRACAAAVPTGSRLLTTAASRACLDANQHIAEQCSGTEQLALHTSLEDLQAAAVLEQAGWGKPHTSADMVDLLRSNYRMECYPAAARGYGFGLPLLSKGEHLLTATKT